MSATPRDLEFVLESVTAGSHAPNERVQAIEGKNRPWVRESGVQALGIGQKYTDGADTGELALRVYVEQKKPGKLVESPVPKKIAPDAGDREITTDVIEIGALRPELFTGTSNPMAAGCGVGNVIDNNVGTLGAIVRRRVNDKLAILSNAHVLARDGLAADGEAIVQPALLDGGSAASDIVAKVAAFANIEFTELGYPNLVDAAIAELDGTRAGEHVIRLLGEGPTGITTNLRRGMHVHKVGRTSDLTLGIIQDVHFKLHFPLRKTARRRARAGFSDQVMCSRFTERGDSGALVLSSSGRAVGLHFAGSVSASIFNRIDNVLDALDVDLVMDGS
jgi:hypothetical protein